MNKWIFKLNKFYHYIFGEKFFKKINFDWDKYPTRLEILQKIIIRKKYKSYLEIGCDKNLLFSKIKIDNKIGIDPKQGGTIRISSDDFFKINDKKFDIIFIDGLHEFDQVRRDISNSLLALNEGGVIFLHDCMPASYLRQAVPRSVGRWNGDVWKNIVEIRTKKDLDTYVCYADNGLGLILKRPNQNLLNLNIKDFKKLKFQDFYYNYKNYLNVVFEKDIDKIF
jgi:hypothetical protein